MPEWMLASALLAAWLATATWSALTRTASSQYLFCDFAPCDIMLYVSCVRIALLPAVCVSEQQCLPPLGLVPVYRPHLCLYTALIFVVVLNTLHRLTIRVFPKGVAQCKSQRLHSAVCRTGENA